MVGVAFQNTCAEPHSMSMHLNVAKGIRFDAIVGCGYQGVVLRCGRPIGRRIIEAVPNSCATCTRRNRATID